MKKLKGMIIGETEKAIWFAVETTEGVLAYPRWIPKSCCYVMERPRKARDILLVMTWVIKKNLAKLDIEPEE